MIDDPDQVIDLMSKLEAQLPIPATPTSDLVRTLRPQGLKIGSPRTVCCSSSACSTWATRAGSPAM